MLSNNGLCIRAAAQYVLLFLVWFNNSDPFQIYGVTRSYSSHLFLCALAVGCPFSFSLAWSITVHLVLVPAAEVVGADIKMEVVSSSVEISTSDSVPTIGSLVSFEEGVKGEAGASATTISNTGTTTTATGTGTAYCLDITPTFQTMPSSICIAHLSFMWKFDQAKVLQTAWV